tara:strand:- start:7100 stop:8791 length:1692 start_codon:yes stop_codon:yes gene_type:complete
MAKKFSGKIKARKTNTAENRALKTDEESAMSVSTPRGDHTINPSLTNVRLERLGRCYRGGKAAIRIWNTLTSTNPSESLDPGRVGPRQDQLGGMSIYGPCAVAPWVGITNDDIPNCKSEVFSAIISRQTPSTRSLRYKKDTYNVEKENVAFWNLPYATFYHNCTNAYDAGEFGSGGAWDSKWNRLMKGGMSSSGNFRESAIATMKNRYFAVCHIYELGETMNTTRLTYTNRDQQVEVVDRNGPFGLAEGDPLYVLWMSSDCGSKILELCQRQKEDWSGDPDENPAGLYRYGDPCGTFNAETGAISGGNIFTIFNPKVWQPDNTKNSTWNGVVPGKDDVASYQVKVNPSYTADSGVKYSASMTADEAGQIFEKNLFGWKEDGDDDDSYLLHETSVEEEATLTARAFADVPKLIEFAWMSNPEYLQYDSVQAVVKSRSQFVMPKEAFEEEKAFADIAEEPEVLAPVEVGDVSPALNTTPDDEFEGGEIEAEGATAATDGDFDDMASAFSSDFEEDKTSSDEFDPEEESSDIETAMETSMSKANSALAKTKSTKRTSPKRKLKRRS